ncbi:MAG: DUF5688 family protein [Velocimicrobium sp.]
MFKVFCEELVAAMQEKMGSDYDIRMNHVVKNNGLELDGIVVLKKEEKTAPTIYINEYFLQHLEGRSMDSILTEIIQITKDEEENSKSVSVQTLISFESIKDKIIYRLVNYEKNKSELKKVPHIRYLDLAITFHCLVKCEEEEIGTIRIHKSMMNRWKVETKQLWEEAKKNTPKLFPIQIRTMTEVIADVLKKEETVVSMEHDFPQSEMYIFSNEAGINGASVLLYEDVIANFAYSNQSDFYILPSSIHEVILIPYQRNFSKNVLSEMVNDVNTTQVPMEDVLSNRVYIYHRNKNAIEM